MILTVYLQPLCNPRIDVASWQVCSAIMSQESSTVHAALLQLGKTQAMQYVGPQVMAATY